jgi:hypothetical protein
MLVSKGAREGQRMSGKGEVLGSVAVGLPCGPYEGAGACGPAVELRLDEGAALVISSLCGNSVA